MTKAAPAHSTSDTDFQAENRSRERARDRQPETETPLWAKVSRTEQTVPVSAARLSDLLKRFSVHARALQCVPTLVGCGVSDIGEGGDKAHYSLETLLEVLLQPILDIHEEFEELERIGLLRAEADRQ